MSKRNKIVAVGIAAVALAAGGVGIATATGGGTVTDTEMGDEESFYEVEVSRDDGSQVDVQLDRDFNVVGDEADSGEDSEAGE